MQIWRFIRLKKLVEIELSLNFLKVKGTAVLIAGLLNNTWLERITTLFSLSEKYPDSSPLAAVPVSPSELMEDNPKQ